MILFYKTSSFSFIVSSRNMHQWFDFRTYEFAKKMCIQRAVLTYSWLLLSMHHATRDIFTGYSSYQPSFASWENNIAQSFFL